MSEDGYMLKSAGDGEMKNRFRAGAKQTAKGPWQVDATVELYGEDAVVLLKSSDVGAEKRKSIGRQLADVVKSVEDELHADGRKLVSDEG